MERTEHGMLWKGLSKKGRIHLGRMRQTFGANRNMDQCLFVYKFGGIRWLLLYLLASAGIQTHRFTQN